MKIAILILVIITIIGLIVGINIKAGVRTPVANKIINETIAKLKDANYQELVGFIGNGYSKQEIKKGLVTYYLGYIVYIPGSVDMTGGFKKIKPGPKPAKNTPVPKIEIAGYVDCVTILPWIDLRMGPYFVFERED
ncbi:MAG: hypothetical protein ABIG46_02280 [Candidatus Omnitrophota bacterium]|nr:hypothetical protein [Candidatus Omnitrophota bacterium]